MTQGKGSSRRPTAIPPDEADRRWPMKRVTVPAGAKYIAGRGWVIPCPVPPLDQQTGEGRMVCWWGCDGFHPLSLPTPPDPPDEPQ
jgi:hypothetical protein